MLMGKRAGLVLALFLWPLGAVQAKEDFHETAQETIKAHVKEDGSPFRRALKQKLKNRHDSGKKIPQDVQYEEPTFEVNENGIGWGKGECEEKGRCETPGYVIRYSVKTNLKYGGPDEVLDPEPGKPIQKWPDLKLRKHYQDANGNWVPSDPPVYADYTQDYKDMVAERAAAEGKVAWKDADHPDGLYEFGTEPLEEEITEEITFTFPKGQEDQGRAFFARLSAAMAAGDATAETAILMGFTYSGPNIDYTIGGKKKVCLFGGCVTIYDIRAGFAMDWALGLRLPAHSRIDGPMQLVAGQNYTYSSLIDASGALGDWTAPQYGAVGAAEENGNEFVMRFSMFAGAKVKILGANVCPYCEYVEIDKNYSKSFKTPFGPGESFPIPTQEIPVKSWDYGIVSLGVGMTVDPNLGSLTISASTPEGQRVDHSSGTPTAFQVKACLDQHDRASRRQEIQLEQYEYWFDYFTLALGAYLDFDVGGYGAWHPSFTFLTLDLSKALGSLGLYVGDHVQCDFAFNCTAAPVDQRVKITADVVDLSAPTTGLDLAGTQGANGWFTSNVSAALKPVDNPVDCGSGIAATTWAVGDGAASPGTSFVLADERIQTVTWRSVDVDGNVEATNARVVKIDKTPPTITGAATTRPNVRDWYQNDVTVHFVASDATSGVSSLTPDTVLSAEATGQSVLGEAVDTAGLASTYVVGGINIDKTPPTIAITVPSSDGYENTETITLAWNVADALSGVLGDTATLDGLPATAATGVPVVNGATVALIELGGGPHELAVRATDKADNVRTATVDFVVDVDIDGLLAAIQFTDAQGWLSKGASKSLTMKAMQAKRALAAGQTSSARSVLLAANAELQALRGRGVKEQAYKILSADVQYVLKRYGLVGTL